MNNVHIPHMVVDPSLRDRISTRLLDQTTTSPSVYWMICLYARNYRHHSSSKTVVYTYSKQTRFQSLYDKACQLDLLPKDQ